MSDTQKRQDLPGWPSKCPKCGHASSPTGPWYISEPWPDVDSDWATCWHCDAPHPTLSRLAHPAPIEGDEARQLAEALAHEKVNHALGPGRSLNIWAPQTNDVIEAARRGITHGREQLEAERDALREALARALPYLDEHVGCEIQEDAPGCYDVTRGVRALLTPREPGVRSCADCLDVATTDEAGGFCEQHQPREPDTTAGPPTETPGQYTPAQRLALASGSRELVNDAFSSRRKEDEAHEVYALPGYTEVTSNPIDAAEAWAAHARDLNDKLKSAVGLLKGHVLWNGRDLDEKMLHDSAVSFLKEIEKSNHEI